MSAGFVDAAAAHVLSNNEILMSAPSNAKLSAFYPTPSESTNTIAQAVCNSGQLFVRSNSKLFNSASDFQVSTANILDSPKLTMSITFPALLAPDVAESVNTFVGSYQEGWGYDLIESIEVSYSNSNISNLIVTGQALRDWSMFQCKNEDERKDLLRTAGRLEFTARNVAKVFKATVPLSFLNWQGAGGIDGGFPLDARTLNGSIQFQIRFRLLTTAFGPLASVYNPVNLSGDTGTAGGGGGAEFYRPGVLTAFPDGFTDLEMTFRTYQLMDSAFSVAHALQANPGMVYSMPSKWINTYRYTVEIDGAGVGEQQLNSAPAGMIQMLMLSIRPIAKGTDFQDLDYNFKALAGTAGGNPTFRPAHYFSLPLKALRLQYSGQSIFDAHTKDQLESFYKEIFHDDLTTEIAGWNETVTMFDGDGTAIESDNNHPERKGIRWVAPLHCIPLMHNGDQVMRHRHFENLPHYSGSTLSLQFTVDNPIFKAAPYPNVNQIDAGDPGKDVPRNMDQEFRDIRAVRSVNQNTNNAGAIIINRGTGDLGLNITRVELQVTYVVAALLQSTNGVVELQL